MKTRNFSAAMISAAIGIAVATPASAGVVAHWTFDSEDEFNNGVISDLSGNGNDLMLLTLDGTAPNEMASFVDLGGGQGAIFFNGTKNGAMSGEVAGQYFSTADDAPLNSLEFLAGYTVEVSFQVPSDWNPDDHRWMGAVARSGKPSGDPAAVNAISNLGEVQWQTQAVGGRQQAVWSPAYFPAFTGWHQTAFVNYQDQDGWHVDMYFDGLLQFRNLVHPEHQGIANYDSPWFVGLGLWNNAPDSAWYGLINDIRITDEPLFAADQIIAPTTGSVPVPGVLPLMVFGMAGLFAVRRKASAC